MYTDVIQETYASGHIDRDKQPSQQHQDEYGLEYEWFQNIIKSL